MNTHLNVALNSKLRILVVSRVRAQLRYDVHESNVTS